MKMKEGIKKTYDWVLEKRGRMETNSRFLDSALEKKWK